MDARKLHLVALGALVFVALYLPGCGRKPAPRATAGRADSAHATQAYENPAAVPHPCPPQPVGPQVGKSDPLLNSARPLIQEWTAMWAQAQPGFVVDSMWATGSERWAPLLSRPYSRTDASGETSPGDDLAYALLGIHSPDGRYILDVDEYQAIEPMGDSIEVGGEPDSQCSLIDAKGQKDHVLMQTGTGGGYQWGAWLSRDAFALGGWCDADDYGQWKQGQLWLYSLRDSTVSAYATRIVSADAYARYEAAWHSWLLRRYRAWKRSHAPA